MILNAAITILALRLLYTAERCKLTFQEIPHD